MKENLIVRTTELALKLISEYLEPGDTALDGTMGNGSDTLALADMVGIGEGKGTVYAFDIQQKALDNTSELLRKNHYECYVVKDRNRSIENLLQDDDGKILLFLESHENLGIHVKKPLDGAIFNLGYLPGEEREIVTKPDSTVAALEQTEALLKAGGIMVVVIYSGHAGGAEEKAAVLEHLAALPASTFHANLITAVNQPPDAPAIALVTRKK